MIRCDWTFLYQPLFKQELCDWSSIVFQKASSSWECEEEAKEWNFWKGGEADHHDWGGTLVGSQGEQLASSLIQGSIYYNTHQVSIKQRCGLGTGGAVGLSEGVRTTVGPPLSPHLWEQAGHITQKTMAWAPIRQSTRRWSKPEHDLFL